MSLLEYIYYLILYLYVVFGFIYFASKLFKLEIKRRLAPPIYNLGVSDSTLDYFSIITLENIFREIGIRQIENIQNLQT